MNRFLISFILILIPALLLAQKNEVAIVKSESGYKLNVNGKAMFINGMN